MKEAGSDGRERAALSKRLDRGQQNHYHRGACHYGPGRAQQILEAENERLREQINTIIFDHALRDESPSKPVLALWDQPLIIKELIGAMEGGSD